MKAQRARVSGRVTLPVHTVETFLAGVVVERLRRARAEESGCKSSSQSPSQSFSFVLKTNVFIPNLYVFILFVCLNVI